MDALRLSRSTYQLIERAVEALECIGRELERYNDRHERDNERTARRDVDRPDRDES
ncbi:hypothetical protein SAMN04488065_2731 [Haloplanus vescus]|jgi:hypothetical protein|uniref:Uncharacterized protein n=1 Tax=Haloplanus vescus TaxID=555874 RepID=A0A1H4ACD5_9EURY|nr:MULTISPECIES: hypothetical protein [Halobacteria]MDT3437459.1 hypothetical protein [Haloarcula sp. 1CSR25-25]SEA33597.1 hypothetical protein SAMN04488065_2731 [Haloplanus vescus]